MRAIFLPAWSTGILGRIYKAIPEAAEGWFDQPPLSYPHGLFSYVDRRKNKHNLSIPNDSHIFGDSGGFTLISKPDEMLDAVSVLQWQAANTTVGAILDRPPRRAEHRDWSGCLAFTVHNLKRALPIYRQVLARGSLFRWWAVLHGETEDEAYDWYEAITAVYPFDLDGEGWGVYPGPEANPYTVARTMRVLKLLRIKRAHFFACTGQEVVATILALGPQAGLEFVTFDSMSHAKAGIQRGWFTTDASLGERRSENARGLQSRVARNPSLFYRQERCLDNVTDRWAATCPCAVCEYLRHVTPRRFTDGSDQEGQDCWRDAAITLHNVRVQLDCIRRHEELACVDPEAFLATALMPSGMSDNEALAEGRRRAAKVLRIFRTRESDRRPPIRSSGLLKMLKR